MAAAGPTEVCGTGQPDAALLDIRLPPSHTDEGLRAADRIRAEYPATVVLIVSAYVEADYVAPLISSGASGVGYLLKDRILELDTVVDALRRIVAGECVLDPALVAELLSPTPAPVPSTHSPAARWRSSAWSPRG